MRILLVNKFWYQRGGAEKVVLATKKVLTDAGHQVEIFGMKDPKNEMQNDYFCKYVGFREGSFLSRFLASLKAIYNFDAKHQFEKLVKDFRPDVIHFHNIYHQLSFSLFDVGKKYKVPMVMTLHDYKMISPNYNLFHHGKIDESCVGHPYKCLFNNCLENFWFSLVAVKEAYFRKFKKYQGFISLYISPSQFLKDKFVSAGWDEKKIVVLSNPVLDINNATTSTGDYVAYIGRLAPDKGLEVLLEAVRNLPKIKFKIIGSGQSETSLKHSAKDLANVEFCGYKTGEELKTLMTGANLIVVPSIWYENCSISILEAKALGKIVIGSRIGGIPELLPEELLFTPGDASDLTEKIKYFYNLAGAERAALENKLKDKIKEINSPEKYYQHLRVIYEKVVAHN